MHSKIPRVGLLPIGQASNAYNQLRVEAFRKGLRETGVIENRDVLACRLKYFKYVTGQSARYARWQTVPPWHFPYESHESHERHVRTHEVGNHRGSKRHRH